MIDRTLDAIDEAYHDSIKNAAMTVWARVSGGEKIEDVIKDFGSHLSNIRRIWELQTREANRLVKGD